MINDVTVGAGRRTEKHTIYPAVESSIGKLFFLSLSTELRGIHKYLVVSIPIYSFHSFLFFLHIFRTRGRIWQSLFITSGPFLYIPLSTRSGTPPKAGQEKRKERQ
jgi:hypothetical protein